MFHSVDYSPNGLKSYCSIIYPNKFVSSERNFLYSTSLPFNITSQIRVGQYYSGQNGCATISNVKINLQYFNANYVTGFMSDSSGN